MTWKTTLSFDEVEYFEIKTAAEKQKLKPIELVYKRYNQGTLKDKKDNEILELKKLISKQNDAIEALKNDIKLCFMNVMKNIETIKYESGLRLKKEFDDEEKFQKIRDDINRKSDDVLKSIEEKFN